MKKNRLLLPALAVLALLATACGKEKQCLCYYEDVDAYYEKTIFVGPGIDCEDISEVAYEERVTTEEGEHTLVRYDEHIIHCREAHNAY